MGGRGMSSAGSTLPSITRERSEQLAKDWSGIGYRAYRRVTAGYSTYVSGLDIGEETVKMAHEFDSWLESGSYDGLIHRGINLTDEDLDSLNVGDTVNQMGSSSWSKNASVAERFSSYGDYNGVVLTMNGTKHGRDIERMSSVSDEEEVAVSSKSSQVIRKISRKNGIIYVEVEEVRDGN